MTTISRFGFVVGAACLLGIGMGGTPVASAQMMSGEVLVSASLPLATLGVPYLVSLGGGGGAPPYRWDILSGALPDGLRLDTEGRISGEPASMGSYVFTIRLTDSRSARVDQTFRLDVGIRSSVPQPSPEPMPLMSPVGMSAPVPPPITPAPPLPDGVPPFPQLPLLGSPVGGVPTLLPQGPSVPANAPASPLVSPPVAAPSLPEGTPPFPQLPLLGSPVGGMPTLLPYAPGAPVATLSPMAPVPAMPAAQVGTATTLTPIELLRHLESKGIEVHSLVRIPWDPSGVNTTVTYYIGRDGRRHAFPHPSVIDSWYRSGLPRVRTLTSEEIQMIPLGANVTYRPGASILQFESASMYVVAGPKTVRLLVDAQAAASLYGPNWVNRLAGLSDAHFADYHLSQELPVSGPSDFNPSALENSVTTPSDTLQI